MVWAEANDDYRWTCRSGLERLTLAILRCNALGRFKCRCNCCSPSLSLDGEKQTPGRCYQHPRFPRSYIRTFECLLSVCFAVHRHYITVPCTFLLPTLHPHHCRFTSSLRHPLHVYFFYMSSVFQHYISTVTRPPPKIGLHRHRCCIIYAVAIRRPLFSRLARGYHGLPIIVGMAKRSNGGTTVMMTQHMALRMFNTYYSTTFTRHAFSWFFSLGQSSTTPSLITNSILAPQSRIGLHPRLIQVISLCVDLVSNQLTLVCPAHVPPFGCLTDRLDKEQICFTYVPALIRFYFRGGRMLRGQFCRYL